MAERNLRVTGRLGLHARAAANLVRVANQFQSNITIYRLDNPLEADAKSILSILILAAARGTELRLVAVGPDEQSAIDALFDLFARNFDEPACGVKVIPSFVVSHRFDHRVGHALAPQIIESMLNQLPSQSFAARFRNDREIRNAPFARFPLQ